MLLSRLCDSMDSLQANAMLCLSCCHVVVGILPVRLQFLSGRVAHSAWRRLRSSVDAPPGVQALPLPVLRVPGQLPTSVQSRCTSDIVARSQSGFLHPPRASRSASVDSQSKVVTTSSDDEIVPMQDNDKISRCASERTWTINCLR